MFTPELQLQTLFVLNEQARIIATREPNPAPGPRFFLIRGPTSCVAATRADVSADLAARVGELVRAEPPIHDFRRDPVHAKRYVTLLGGLVESGPAFTFPDTMPNSAPTVLVDDVARLTQHFRGWTADEIPERGPIVAIMERGQAVSVCFSARRSPLAAEAGVETAQPFRGRGLAPRATAAWAVAIRASGRLPIYSTSWTNAASLAVARKLALTARASNWSLSDAIAPPSQL